MTHSNAYAHLRRVDYGGQKLWAASLPDLDDPTEGTGETHEAALDNLVQQLAERLTRVRAGLAARAAAREGVHPHPVQPVDIVAAAFAVKPGGLMSNDPAEVSAARRRVGTAEVRAVEGVRKRAAKTP